MISPGLVRVVGRRRHPVGDEPPDLGGDAGRRSVGEVAAVVEAHGQDGVARLEQGLVDGQVGVGPGVGLDVGVLGPEQRAQALAGQVLDLVDDLVAAVVAAARVALGVLVGEDRAGGGQHGRRGEVLRGDELQGGRLALGLVAQERGDLGVAGQPVRRRARRRTWVVMIGGRASLRAARARRVGVGAAVPGPAQRRLAAGAGGGRPRRSVVKKVSTASMASAAPRVRPPRQTTLASLWRRASEAVVTSWTSGGPDAGDLVGGHGDADAGAADADPASARPSATARPTAGAEGRDSRPRRRRSRSRGR